MIKYIFLPFIALSLMQCNSSEKSDPSEQEANSKETIYMCQCHEGKNEFSDTSKMEKKVYVYLVKSEEFPDCCTNTLVESYDAYVQSWVNNQPGSKKIVWSTNDQSIDTITASEALKLSCSLEEKSFGVHSIKKLSPEFQKFYPELSTAN